MLVLFFCHQKTAYEVRISDWSSDVCSSDLLFPEVDLQLVSGAVRIGVARCVTRSEPARVGERLRLEAPILLVGKGAGSELRPPEIETRAALFARVTHQREIHQFVGAHPPRVHGPSAPLGHHGPAPTGA